MGLYTGWPSSLTPVAGWFFRPLYLNSKIRKWVQWRDFEICFTWYPTDIQVSCGVDSCNLPPKIRLDKDGLDWVSAGLWIFQITGRAFPSLTKWRQTSQLPWKSWRKTARMILTTKTRLHHQLLQCSYFSIPYVLVSLLISMEKWTKNNEKNNQKMSESRNSCTMIVGGVEVEDMMTPGKIGALVWGWIKGQHV